MSVYKKITNIVAESIDEASMKNKELITELSVKLGWTSKEVTEMLAAFGAVVGSKLADNDAPVNNQCGYTSFTHPWSAGVAKWLSEEVLGVKPEVPGFKTFTVCPHLTTGLTRIDGAVPTPHGKIKVYMDVKEGKGSLSVPAGTTGRLAIPLMGAANIEIKMDGQTILPEKKNATHVYLPVLNEGSHTFSFSYVLLKARWLKKISSTVIRLRR